MALSQLQERLQDIYELELNQRVDDYLITRRDIADARLQPVIKSGESLLVYQNNDDLYLSLYLQEGIQENLKIEGTEICLHHGNLQDFCLALEGISHFVYLIWNATYHRCVTRLEMEIQAEIDKFIILSSYVSQSRISTVPGILRKLLFESVRYHENLTVQEIQRYRDANRYAETYCRLLEASDLLNHGQEAGLLRELRRFYRLGLRDKLHRIQRFH